MRPERYTIAAVAGSLLAVLIPLLTYQQVNFKVTLKDTERAVANFRPTTLVVPRKAWQPVTLTSPVIAAPPPAPAAATGTPPTPSSKQTPPVIAVPSPTVSFILHDNGKDMAIINGNVLKTGDRYQEWRVERIERNRVLLSGRKGPLWITLQ